MTNTSEQIQKKISRYVTISVIMLALLIAAISIYPFYIKLRESEQNDLVFVRNTSGIIVNNYINQMKMIAQHISNESNRAGYDSVKLARLIDASTNIVGMIKLDSNNQVILQSGKTSFFKQDSIPQSKEATVLSTPVAWNDHYYIAASCPVLDAQSVKIGTDIILFDITALQAKIDKKLQFRIGEVIIADTQNTSPYIFSPNKSQWNSAIQSNKFLSTTIKLAASDQVEGVSSGMVDKKAIYIAYAPLNEPGWVIATIIKKSNLFADLESTTLLIIIIIALVMLLFIIGLHYTLSPLTGKIILRDIELANKIEESQKRLREANKRLSTLVNQDPLTNAYNRRGFNREMEKIFSQAKRRSTPFTLFFIDVNKFKAINDTYGHDAGDLLLQQLATRISESMRKEDVVARIGGDEFAVISPNISEKEADTVRQKISECTQLPVMFEDQPLNYSISIGSATYPINGDSIESILSFADAVMYKHKSR